MKQMADWLETLGMPECTQRFAENGIDVSVLRNRAGERQLDMWFEFHCVDTTGQSRLTVPLQNRVSPFGELCAFSARGLFMGNRGGRFHTDAKALTARRWASRQWICCVLDFKSRRRDVWGRFYTELFFLDEPTALAAGHRPCFECRRKDAETFAEKWREARRLGRLPYAPEMDDVLHHERVRGGAKRLHRRNLDELPDGAFAAFDQTAFAIQGDTLLRWTPNGYHGRKPRPPRISVDVLTPPTILAVLSAGYKPRWHQSAKKQPL